MVGDEMRAGSCCRDTGIGALQNTDELMVVNPRILMGSQWDLFFQFRKYEKVMVVKCFVSFVDN